MTFGSVNLTATFSSYLIVPVAGVVGDQKRKSKSDRCNSNCFFAIIIRLICTVKITFCPSSSPCLTGVVTVAVVLDLVTLVIGNCNV